VLLNAVADSLPPGDVVILKQVLQHLRNADIAAIVEKLAQYPTNLRHRSLSNRTPPHTSRPVRTASDPVRVSYSHEPTPEES